MKKVIKKLFPMALLLLMTTTLVTTGCGTPDANVASKSVTSNINSFAFAPSSPIKVELSISKLPILNEQVEITCKVTSRCDAPDSTAQIKFSKGALLIDGLQEWQGDLMANIPVSFSSQVVFKEAGHQIIEASATHMIDDKNGWGDLDAIYLDIGFESSTFGWPVTPVPVIRTDKYSVIKTDIEISHAPKLNEPAKLFITTVSPVDFPDLSVGILIYPKSAVLLDSDSKLTAVPLVPGANQVAMQVTGLDLQANIPYHFSAMVVFNETGYYHVTAGARESVDNTTYHGTQDTIYLKIGTKESTFERESPEETPPENLPIPPAARP